jgi:pimeloyl-ACP methyl ester carboxylesterase
MGSEGLDRATANGAELRYRRTGGGRPVVLVHTLRTQLEYFDHLLEHLDTAKVEVFEIDLPGHGESSAPAVDYTADYFTDSVAALLDRLALNDVVVVGESIGGTIALALAARHNPRRERDCSQPVRLRPPGRDPPKLILGQRLVHRHSLAGGRPSRRADEYSGDPAPGDGRGPVRPRSVAAGADQ